MAAGKTPISIVELLGMEERRKQINAIPLEDIEWIGEDGKAFLPAKGVVDEWRFMGMSNIQFIITGFYKAPSADDEDPRWAEGLGKFEEHRPLFQCSTCKAFYNEADDVMPSFGVDLICPKCLKARGGV